MATEKNTQSEVNTEIKDKWYIFRVQSGREEQMLAALKNAFLTLKKDGLDPKYYFTDYNVPKRTIIKYVDGKQTEKVVTAYPGYLFLKARMTDDIILFLRKFFQMNGFGSMLPNAITDAEYKKMMDSVNKMNTPKVKNPLDELNKLGKDVKNPLGRTISRQQQNVERTVERKVKTAAQKEAEAAKKKLMEKLGKKSSQNGKNRNISI